MALASFSVRFGLPFARWVWVFLSFFFFLSSFLPSFPPFFLFFFFSFFVCAHVENTPSAFSSNAVITTAEWVWQCSLSHGALDRDRDSYGSPALRRTTQEPERAPTSIYSDDVWRPPEFGFPNNPVPWQSCSVLPTLPQSPAPPRTSQKPRETDEETDRQTDRQKQRYRDTETETQKQKHRDRESVRETGRTETETERQTETETERDRDRD